MVHPTLETALAEAQGRLKVALRSPRGRLALREAFYTREDRYRSFGRSELAFLRYEISRGVLTRGRSAWWRGINAGICRDAERALAWHDARRFPDATEAPAVRLWAEFLDAPADEIWYRAHNSSVARAYVKSNTVARREVPTERHFMGEVLDRVLFAHALAAGRAGDFGKFVADPESAGVELLVRDPDLYPPVYPAPKDVQSLLERLLDTGIALLRSELYDWSAEALGVPELRRIGAVGYPL